MLVGHISVMRVILPLFNCRFDCDGTKFTDDLNEESCYKDEGQYKSECIDTSLAVFGRAKRSKYSTCQMHI